MFFVGIFITLIVWSFDGHLLFLLATLQFIGCPGICKNMSGLVSDTDVYFYQEKCVVLIKNLYVCVCACVSVCVAFAAPRLCIRPRRNLRGIVPGSQKFKSSRQKQGNKRSTPLKQ